MSNIGVARVGHFYSECAKGGISQDANDRNGDKVEWKIDCSRGWGGMKKRVDFWFSPLFRVLSFGFIQTHFSVIQLRMNTPTQTPAQTVSNVVVLKRLVHLVLGDRNESKLGIAEQEREPSENEWYEPRLTNLIRSNQLTALLTMIRDVKTPRGEFIFHSDRIIRSVKSKFS